MAKLQKIESGFPNNVAVMLCSTADRPFTRRGWIYEPKFDGIRTVALLRKGKVTLKSRRGLDLTERYPDIVESLRISAERFDFVLDGEIVALNSKGVPSFQLLQNAAEEKQRRRLALVYYVFDVVFIDKYKVTPLPLRQRKKILLQKLCTDNNVKLVKDLGNSGEAAFKACIKHGMEGIVAKRADSSYEMGRRSLDWVKIKSFNSSEFVIAGYTAGTGNRCAHFGALLLGYCDSSGKLRYAGNVGTGFNQKMLQQLDKLMKPLRSADSPFKNKEKIPKVRFVKWLTPKLVAEIKYAEVTEGGRLRKPVFLRLREDVPLRQTGAHK